MQAPGAYTPSTPSSNLIVYCSILKKQFRAGRYYSLSARLLNELNVLVD